MQNAYFARPPILAPPDALARNQPLVPIESLKIGPGRESVGELLFGLIRGITEHEKTTGPSGGYPGECVLRVPPWQRKNSRNCGGKGLPFPALPTIGTGASHLGASAYPILEHISIDQPLVFLTGNIN